jgi:hypothetical protein
MTLDRGRSLMLTAARGPDKATPQLKYPVAKQA